MSDFFKPINMSNVSTAPSGIPDGDHMVTCQKVEIKTSEKGAYINATFALHNGSGKIWHMFFFEHTNDDFLKRSLGQLKAFLTAAGHPTPDNLTDPNQMINLACKVKVKSEDKNDGYGPKTQIKLFLKPEAAVPVGGVAPPVATNPFG